MQISLDTGDMSQAEARGLIALIITLHPEAAATHALEVGPSATDVARDIYTDAARLMLSNSDEPEPDAADVFTAEPEPAAVFAVAPMPSETGVPFADTATEAAGSTATPTLAPAPASAGELDINGLPWDARIHTETKAKNKDGSWRQKRNCDKDLAAQVTAELRAAMAAPVALPPAEAPAASVSATPPPPTPAAVPVPPAAPAAPAAEAGPAPAPPAPPAPAPAAVPTPPAPSSAPDTSGAVPGPVEFARIMQKVAQATNVAKTVTQPETSAILVGIGLANLRDLLTRPDLIPAFEAQFDLLAAG